MKSCFENHKSFSHRSTNNLSETGHNLPIGRLFSGLEEKCTASKVLSRFSREGRGEKVEDPIIVYFIHGNDNGIFSLAVSLYSEITDIWQMR